MIKNLDEKIVILTNKLYKINKNEEQELREILKTLTYDEKLEIAYSLWEKIKKDESIIKKFLQKIKLLKNNLKEMKIKEEADNLLANI